MSTDPNTWPRLYHAASLGCGQSVILDKSAVHYLNDVLRKKVGDMVRVFNGSDGEFHARITNTSTLTIEKLSRPANPAYAARHLFFTPLPKDRLDFLIEKAVELGVTHLHPFVSERTTIRSLKTERIERQIIEALEQSERLQPPALSVLTSFEAMRADVDFGPIHVAIERASMPANVFTPGTSDNFAFMVGPPGGWSDGEKKHLLGHPDRFTPISLGPAVLRSETAALALLARVL